MTTDATIDTQRARAVCTPLTRANTTSRARKAYEKWAILHAFRRREPAVISLPTVTTSHLAQIILQSIRRKGYLLSSTVGMLEASAGGAAVAMRREEDVNQAAMEHIVTHKYSHSIISHRNAHLANDLLERAISRKNERMEVIATVRIGQC